METGRIVISRAARQAEYPARFQLIAAMNPCPCGYFGDPKRECRCGSQQVLKYRQRISGPLLDRIDIHVEVPIVDYKELSGKATGEPSSSIRARVENVRNRQLERFAANVEVNVGVGVGEVTGVTTNSSMTPRLMKQHCQLEAESAGLLEQAMNELNFSARAHDRILKVARTLADLADNETIQPDNLLEAIQYRSLDRTLWT